MLNIISLVLGIGAWAVAAIAIAKPSYSHKNTIVSSALCTFSLISQLFEISRRVSLGDYAAIEDTIRAVLIASVMLCVTTIILNVVAFIKARKK